MHEVAGEFGAFRVRQVQGFTAESLDDSAGHGVYPIDRCVAVDSSPEATARATSEAVAFAEIHVCPGIFDHSTSDESTSFGAASGSFCYGLRQDRFIDAAAAQLIEQRLNA